MSKMTYFGYFFKYIVSYSKYIKIYKNVGEKAMLHNEGGQVDL